MSDEVMASLLWDNAVRDLEAERAEMARSAALQDAEASVWPHLALAVSESDLENRLALAGPQMHRIAAARGYSAEELQEDLVRRWALLDEARQAREAELAPQREAAALKAQAAAEQREQVEALRVQAVAAMAAMAAQENPHLPMQQCLALAEEAAEAHFPKTAEAFPLAYDAWQHVVNGPFMQRIRNWRPGKPKVQAPAAPQGHAPGGGADAFDEVHRRLDALDERVNGPRPAARPSEATPGRVPDLDLSEHLNRVDRAVHDNAVQPVHGWDQPFMRGDSDQFAERRLDHLQDSLDRERSRSDASAPSHEDVNANMDRRMDHLEQGLGGGSAAPSRPAAPRPRHAPGTGQGTLF